MTAAPKTDATSANEDKTPPNTAHAPASALSREHESRRAKQRQELAQRFSFGAKGFAHLADRASDTRARLAGMGASDAVLARADAWRRLFTDVQKLLEDPSASVVPPTNDEVYRAGLETAQLDEISKTLERGPWRAHTTALLDHAVAGAGSVATTRTTLLFASVCRRGGLAITPPKAGTGSRAPGTGSDTGAGTIATDLDAELDLAGWHVGVVVRTPATGGEVIDAARDAGAALKRARCPGLVVLNLTTALPAPARANRVDRDETALGEMQRHLDRALVDRREALADASGDLAFGLLACATMRTTTVSSARVAFATLFRGINLCEMDDPRIEKLAWFLERFAKG